MDEPLLLFIYYFHLDLSHFTETNADALAVKVTV